MKISEKVDSLFNLGSQLQKQNKPIEAFSKYVEAISIVPEFIPALSSALERILFQLAKDVLDLEQKDFDGSEPVRSVDQKSKQLLAEKQEPIRGKLTKVDYEYQRNRIQNIFVGVEPKGGKRIVKVTDHRKKADFAQYIKELVEVHYG